MITKCLSCGKIFNVVTSWNGQSATCDSCGKDFTVMKYIECPQCSQLTPKDWDKCESCDSLISFPLQCPSQLKSALTMPSRKQKSQSVNSDSDKTASKSGSPISSKYKNKKRRRL